MKKFYSSRILFFIFLIASFISAKENIKQKLFLYDFKENKKHTEEIFLKQLGSIHDPLVARERIIKHCEEDYKKIERLFKLAEARDHYSAMLHITNTLTSFKPKSVFNNVVHFFKSPDIIAPQPADCFSHKMLPNLILTFYRLSPKDIVVVKSNENTYTELKKNAQHIIEKSAFAEKNIFGFLCHLSIEIAKLGPKDFRGDLFDHICKLLVEYKNKTREIENINTNLLEVIHLYTKDLTPQNINAVLSQMLLDFCTRSPKLSNHDALYPACIYWHLLHLEHGNFPELNYVLGRCLMTVDYKTFKYGVLKAFNQSQLLPIYMPSDDQSKLDKLFALKENLFLNKCRIRTSATLYHYNFIECNDSKTWNRYCKQINNQNFHPHIFTDLLTYDAAKIIASMRTYDIHFDTKVNNNVFTVIITQGKDKIATLMLDKKHSLYTEKGYTVIEKILLNDNNLYHALKESFSFISSWFAINPHENFNMDELQYNSELLKKAKQFINPLQKESQDSTSCKKGKISRQRSTPVNSADCKQMRLSSSKKTSFSLQDYTHLFNQETPITITQLKNEQSKES